ncbi:MAG: 30S ribosomal protein S20 [Pseudobdellovibrionaceae bacterium]
MANHKSSEKRARQAIKRNAVNTRRENEIKTFEKKILAAVAAKNQKDATEALKAFMSKVSKASTKGVLKRETASRKVARISARVSAITK